MDKVSKVREWIKNISVKREELGGFSICPYAFSASVEIIECALTSVALKPGDAEVIVYIVEDSVSLAAMLQKVTELNMRHPDYLFLDDHVSEPTFINGVQTNFNEFNIIIAQKHDKLLKARENLHKTDYYKFWSEELYNKIVRKG